MKNIFFIILIPREIFHGTPCVYSLALLTLECIIQSSTMVKRVSLVEFVRRVCKYLRLPCSIRERLERFRTKINRTACRESIRKLSTINTRLALVHTGVCFPRGCSLHPEVWFINRNVDLEGIKPFLSSYSLITWLPIVCKFFHGPLCTVTDKIDSNENHIASKTRVSLNHIHIVIIRCSVASIKLPGSITKRKKKEP